MDSDYKQLFERSVTVQEGTLQVLKNLEENSKKFNDSFILHQKDSEEVKRLVEQSHRLLLKYLRWAIIALIVLLGGREIVSFTMGI